MFIKGVIVGLFIGATVGFILAGILCVARDDEEM